MKTYTGFSTDTAKKLLLDAGAFFKNFTVGTDTYETAKASGKLLGATQGGGEFAAVPEIRTIEVDGIKGRAKGLDVLDAWAVTLKANVLEISKDALKMALISAKEETVDGYTKITAGDTIELADYIENITWVGTLSGSNTPVIIQVYNAFAGDGLTLTPTEKSQGVIALTFYGHYDVSDEGTLEAPFAIFYPNVQ